MFFETVIRALTNHKIEYAVVGGFALSLQGVVRGTVDLDLVIAFSKENFIKIEKILNSLGLESKLPVTGGQVFDFREDYLQNKNMIAWNFYHPKRPIENVDVILTINCKDIKIDKIKAFGMTIQVASCDDLIRMKEAADRPQDRQDIAALKSLKKGSK